MNFIRENLQHAEDCQSIFVTWKPNGECVPYDCTCGHTEALARAEAMEAFVVAFGDYQRIITHGDAKKRETARRALIAAYKAVEGE